MDILSYSQISPSRLKVFAGYIYIYTFINLYIYIYIYIIYIHIYIYVYVLNFKQALEEIRTEVGDDESFCRNVCICKCMYMVI